MKKLYESLCRLAEEKSYNIGFDSERHIIQGDSQFLSSRPEFGPLIGIVPMTGKGIDADVDDLFCEKE